MVAVGAGLGRIVEVGPGVEGGNGLATLQAERTSANMMANTSVFLILHSHLMIGLMDAGKAFPPLLKTRHPAR